jgi:hypothetical protein
MMNALNQIRVFKHELNAKCRSIMNNVLSDLCLVAVSDALGQVTPPACGLAGTNIGPPGPMNETAAYRQQLARQDPNLVAERHRPAIMLRYIIFGH